VIEDYNKGITNPNGVFSGIARHNISQYGICNHHYHYRKLIRFLCIFRLQGTLKHFGAEIRNHEAEYYLLSLTHSSRLRSLSISGITEVRNAYTVLVKDKVIPVLN
jgi:hypothetical protein